MSERPLPFGQLWLKGPGECCCGPVVWAALGCWEFTAFKEDVRDEPGHNAGPVHRSLVLVRERSCLAHIKHERRWTSPSAPWISWPNALVPRYALLNAHCQNLEKTYFLQGQWRGPWLSCLIHSWFRNPCLFGVWYSGRLHHPWKKTLESWSFIYIFM